MDIKRDPVFIADLHNDEILPQQGELAGKRYQIGLFSDDVAELEGQAFQQFCALGIVIVQSDHADDIQGVIQKMGLDLHFQGV